MPDIAVESLRDEHWPDVAAIYEDGLRTGEATLETEVPSWADWDAAHHADQRLVARVDGEVVGWAALSPVSRRAVYAGAAEVSVYVAARARATGVGRALLTALVEASERAGMWTLQAAVFPENHASLALHQVCGFRTVGVRERLGRLHGRWRDVVLLERRSPLVS